MKLETKKTSYESKWFDFGDARLKVRPYPASRVDIGFKAGQVIIAGESSYEMFAYCLTEWEGVVDSDGTELKLTDAVKKTIFDFKLGTIDGVTMSDFVISKAREIMEAITEDIKN